MRPSEARRLTVAAFPILTLLVFVFLRHNTKQTRQEWTRANVSSPLNAIWQVPEDVCGHRWQQEYKNLHNRIIQGRSPERLVVSVAIETGIADRLLGTVSAFFYALLTRRAFQITTRGELPGLELALAPNQISWLRQPLSAELLWPISHDAHNSDPRKFPPSIDRHRFAFVHHWHDDAYDDADEMFMRRNISTLPESNPDAAVVLMVSNRGRSVQMFDNPFHGQQLQEWGLRPETAFACACRFLFKPVDAVAERVSSELDVLMHKRRSALKIGIHIRIGDEEMGGPDFGEGVRLPLIERAQPFWGCAEQIETWRRREGQDVLWYLISDSLRLRQAAAQRFGHKVFTDTQHEAVHVDCARFAACRGHEDVKAAAMHAAMGEILALAATDIQVIPENSGFGKIGAMLNPRAQKFIYSIPGYAWEKYEERDCGLGKNDTIRFLADLWSGL